MRERKLFNFFRDVLPAGFNSRCVSVLKRGFRVLNKSLALVGVGLKIVFSVGEPAADVSGRFCKRRVNSECGTEAGLRRLVAGKDDYCSVLAAVLVV